MKKEMHKTIEKIYDIEETIKIHREGLKSEKETLIAQLIMWRKNQGISMRRIAEKLGITPAYLSDIECGRRNVSDEVITKIIDKVLTP